MDIEKMQRQLADLMAFKARAEPMVQDWECYERRRNGQPDPTVEQQLSPELLAEIHAPLPQEIPAAQPETDEERAAREAQEQADARDAAEAARAEREAEQLERDKAAVAEAVRAQEERDAQLSKMREAAPKAETDATG